MGSMDKKDKFGIAFSAIALLLSTIAIYGSSINQSDDVRAILQGSFRLSALPKGEAISLVMFADQTLTVVNAGHRSAALTQAEILIRTGATAIQSNGRCDQKAGDFIVFPYQFTRVSLKPGEVQVVTLKTPGDADESDEKTWYEPDRDPDVPLRREIFFTICARFSVVTPSTIEEKRILLDSGHMFEGGAGEYGPPAVLKAPFVLAKRFGTIFW